MTHTLLVGEICELQVTEPTNGSLELLVNHDQKLLDFVVSQKGPIGSHHVVLKHVEELLGFIFEPLNDARTAGAGEAWVQ